MKLVDTRAHNINHPEVVALRANVIVIVVVQNKAGQSCFDVISSTIKFREITVLALLLTVKTLHVIHTIRHAHSSLLSTYMLALSHDAL